MKQNFIYGWLYSDITNDGAYTKQKKNKMSYICASKSKQPDF